MDLAIGLDLEAFSAFFGVDLTGVSSQGSGIGFCTDSCPLTPGKVVTLAEAKREHIVGALRETGWVVAGPKGAAARLEDEAFDLARENEKSRHLPAPVVPARRQPYRPGGTSYLALPVLTANGLDPSNPQVPLNAAFTMRSDRFRPCRHGPCF